MRVAGHGMSRRMLRTVVLGWALVLIGCGSEPDAESCGFEDGAYLATYQRVSGSCPDMENKLIVPDDVPAGCTQSLKYGDDCSVSGSRECVLDGNRVRSVLSVGPQGTGYVGNVQFTIVSPNPNVSCSGLYNVSYAAQ